MDGRVSKISVYSASPMLANTLCPATVAIGEELRPIVATYD